MPYLTWSNEFSIGVRVFDDEHKELVALANMLHEAIVSGLDVAGLRELEGQFFAHVAEHFRHEEMFFDDYAFAEEHAEQHAILLQRVAAYRQAAAADPDAELCAEMLDFLSGALVRHIASSDMTLGAHLRATHRADLAGTPLLQSSPDMSKSG